MKEDFIMVHLQHACTHCSLLMVSGARWVCNKCKKFQLCDNFGQCWTFWCMLHNVAIHIANTPTAAKLRDFFATVCNAVYALQEVAVCIRGCGIFFSCTPELAESWNVLCHVARSLFLLALILVFLEKQQKTVDIRTCDQSVAKVSAWKAEDGGSINHPALNLLTKVGNMTQEVDMQGWAK